LSLANLLIGNDELLLFNVQAVFDGDEPCSATAYALTPNGTEYAVCTTIQYGFKPISNNTWLTVEPQSTQVMTTTKTPEQLQQEAEDSRWLSTRHEFTWWYPWYRLHLNMSTAPPIELVFAPFALDMNVKIYDEQDFAQKLEDAFDIGYDLAWGIIAGHIAAEIAARILGKSSILALFLAIGINAGVQVALAYAANANQKTARTWLISFFASLISAGGTAVVNLFTGTLLKWMTSIVKRLTGTVCHVFNSWWGSGLAWDLITAIPFILLDVVLALFFYNNYCSGVVI
jgi:hypothetical protein